ncbi:hypothetical protein [Terribacillus saccharophilus]|uniref:Uncharacterized protein n=1 Tax=Terribacillus saccharophilus TaxID=361277 RepID=A0A268AAP8_9BACI|nr:hypothetical protein [Terribacillus saccharophilus]PAD21200.1 hypothetical protein CHH64_09705 [Terribacillus saccharophilus]PAF36001.1 hypothetical protein CHH58_13660 [Terribacillus saccharophilus]
MKRFDYTDVIILLTFIVFMTSIDLSHMKLLEWGVLIVYSIWAFLMGLKTIDILKQSRPEN